MLNCVDVNECADDTDDCGENATCGNNVGSFTCTCNNGFTGDGRVCEPLVSPTGYKVGATNTCVDVNECSTNTDTCSADATCSNT